MTNKEFEDFFKDLDPAEPSAKNSIPDDGEDLVFSSFFEDATSSAAKKEEAKKSSYDDFEFEDDVFAPPPPEEDAEPVAPPKNAVKQYVPAEQPVKKAVQKTEEKPAERKKSKKNKYNTIYNWLLTVVWVSAVLAVSVFIAIFALSSINDLVGFNKESREVEIVIPEGAGLSEVADILDENGIIDEPFTFEVYAMVKDMDGRLAPGTYVLNSNLGYDQIFQILKTKDVAKNVVTITFREGLTINEIAKLLEENGVCGYDEFITAANTESFEYEFESMMGTDSNIYHKWEGYLFPDTYEFYIDSTPRSVIAKFIANFNNKISPYFVRMQELGMSLDEVMTLASMIQEEAAYMVDMEIVSSVFHNRLAPDSWLPYLQSDVTWFYYTDNIEPFVEDEALKDAYIDSYYTYPDYRKGLPVGPICNPGLNAIEAALYPENTNYYFFLTDKTGKFYYAETQAEHEINDAAAKQVNASLGD